MADATGTGLVGLWGNVSLGWGLVMNITNGNVNIGNGAANPTNKLQVVSAYCTGTTWVNASDRNLKDSVAGIDPVEVLAKVAALPITSWSYKTQPGERHLGPFAQDFHAAFGLGDSDRAISTVDEGGVALAAIQGLNQKVEGGTKKVEAQEAQISELQRQNAELKSRLEKLEQRLTAQGATK